MNAPVLTLKERLKNRKYTLIRPMQWKGSDDFLAEHFKLFSTFFGMCECSLAVDHITASVYLALSGNKSNNHKYILFEYMN